MNHLQTLQGSDLQARLGTTNLDKLVDFLTNTGQLCLDRIEGMIVVKFISFGGRVIRAFGKSFTDAIRSLSYQAWVLRRV